VPSNSSSRIRVAFAGVLATTRAFMQKAKKIVEFIWMAAW
jgi:hypothetical protein